MVAIFTSRVFAAISQITTDLEGATWPPHPITNITPTVGVGSSASPKEDETEVGEFIDVLYRVEEDASIEWTRIKGREERFLIDVYVRSSVPDSDRPTTWERLEQLAAVVQGRYLSWNGSQVLFAPPAFEGVALLGGVERVTPQMWRTDAGWAGDCLVTFRIAARLDQEVSQ